MMLLPPLALAALLALARRRGHGWRKSLVLALLAWLALAFAFTELLSLFGAVKKVPLAVAWALSSGTAILAVVVGRASSLSSAPHARDSARSWKPALLPACIVALALATLLIALLVPPTTYDSLTYHLARVEHWADAGSVAHFPTHIERQVMFPPLAEYAILQSFVLGGGSDWLANSVQWLAWLGCIAAVSLIARALGGSVRAQSFAALFAASAPMLALQASSTQNDLLCAALLAAAIWLGIESLRAPRVAALAGLALGLAICTKGTAYVFAFPFCAAWAVAAWRAWGWRKMLLHGALLSSLVLAVNLPLWARNFATYRHPLGSPEVLALVKNETHARFPSNVLREAALELGAGSGSWASRAERAVLAVHRALGWDASDPATTLVDTRFELRSFKPHEDFQGNPFHALLLLAALPACLLRRETRAYTLCWLAAAALFAFSMKWQPYNNRLHVPLIALAAVPAALWLGRFRHATTVTALLFTALALRVAWLAEDRDVPRLLSPEKPRIARYFTTPVRDAEQYHAAIAALPQSGSVGLVLAEDVPEYLFWRLARETGRSPRFFHHAVSNPSARPAEPQPAAILSFDRPDFSPPPGWRSALELSRARVFLPGG